MKKPIAHTNGLRLYAVSLFDRGDRRCWRTMAWAGSGLQAVMIASKRPNCPKWAASGRAIVVIDDDLVPLFESVLNPPESSSNP